VYSSAAIAHERAEPADAGLTVLTEGGNAVDAAVAVAFAACVVMPAWTTIAGSGFMLVKPSPREAPVSIEFPPRAPLAASPDMYEEETADERTALIGVSAVKNDANIRGGDAVGVPAAVAGLCEAHARFGCLPLERVMLPAIDLAGEGFRNYADLQLHTIDVLHDLRRAGPSVRGTLLTSDGLPRPITAATGEPDHIVQPELASVLELIASEGPDAFYQGEIAETIVAEVKRHGGRLSIEDMAKQEPLVRAPLSMRVGAATVWGPSSPGGGWTELQLLGLLARLDGMLDGESPFDLQVFIEASRRCFADRFHFMGDPEHVEVPLDVLLGDSYLDHLAEEVRGVATGAKKRLAYPAPAPWLHYASHTPEGFARARPDLMPTAWSKACRSGAGLGDSFETTHVSAIDEAGMAVSCTLTAAHSFGSRVVASGVVLDDAMVWFNAVKGAANSIAPWKRALVNMGPLIVEDARGQVLAVGAPGGRRVMSAVSQVTAHWLRGDGLDQATARPRVDASGGEVLASARLDAEAIDGLADAGYRLRRIEDRDRFCSEFALPVAVSSTSIGRREAAVQPFVLGSVRGR
jgi:gamma-glutamyltranspeptidase / glutathione hydrolase